MLMPFRNSRRARGPLLLGWFIASLLAVASSPTVIPAEGGDSDRTQPAATATAERFGFPLVEVRRDPFVPFPGDVTSTGASGDDSTFALPPNDAASGLPTGVPRTGSAPTLRAIIVGTAPKALVDIAGRPTLVSVGSQLFRSTVVSIQKDGIVLANGESLGFSEGRPR